MKRGVAEVEGAKKGKEHLVRIAVPTYSGGTSRLPNLEKEGLDNMIPYFQIRWLIFVVSTESAVWTKRTQFHLRQKILVNTVFNDGFSSSSY
jgi:hypothetical protein